MNDPTGVGGGGGGGAPLPPPDDDSNLARRIADLLQNSSATSASTAPQGFQSYSQTSDDMGGGNGAVTGMGAHEYGYSGGRGGGGSAVATANASSNNPLGFAHPAGIIMQSSPAQRGQPQLSQQLQALQSSLGLGSNSLFATTAAQQQNQQDRMSGWGGGYPPQQQQQQQQQLSQQQQQLYEYLNSQNQRTTSASIGIGSSNMLDTLRQATGSYHQGSSHSTVPAPSFSSYEPIPNSYLDYLSQQIGRDSSLNAAAASGGSMMQGGTSTLEALLAQSAARHQSEAQLLQRLGAASSSPQGGLGLGGGGLGGLHGTTHYQMPLYQAEALRLLSEQQQRGLGAGVVGDSASTLFGNNNPLYGAQQQSLMLDPRWSEGKEEGKESLSFFNQRGASTTAAPEPASATTTLGDDSNNDNEPEVPWVDLMGNDDNNDNRPLSLPALRGTVSDWHLAALAQMQPCRLTREDRVGQYKTRSIGSAGLACRHCGGVPSGFGRYFPSSVTNLVNGNICKTITKHLSEECRVCPPHIKASLLKLERDEERYPYHYQRGARSHFFTRIWQIVQNDATTVATGDGTTDSAATRKPTVAGAKRSATAAAAASIPKESERSSASEDATAQSQGSNRSGARRPAAAAAAAAQPPLQEEDSTIPWAAILQKSEIVELGDRHLVPDSIFAATAQTKPCVVTEADRVGRCKEHKLGAMGLCCKHCEGKPGSYGRYFPSNLHTFAQVEVSKQIVKHITNKCPSVPDDIREAILAMQHDEGDQRAKKYPSRMVFFRRVWFRFHYGDASGGDATGEDDDTKPSATSTGEGLLSPDDIPWNDLVQESELVTLADRGLISDSQFAAIAQMERCALTADDRVGYCKNHAIGFVGMACRYCKGRPGFGRYFATTIRNLEKTSARDTLVSHVSLFCQQCPSNIRNALLSLKRIESSHDGSATMQSLTYGSGKLFFRRVWSRLHGEEGGSSARAGAGGMADEEGGRGGGGGGTSGGGKKRNSAKRKVPTPSKSTTAPTAAAAATASAAAASRAAETTSTEEDIEADDDDDDDSEDSITEQVARKSATSQPSRKRHDAEPDVRKKPPQSKDSKRRRK